MVIAVRELYSGPEGPNTKAFLKSTKFHKILKVRKI